MLYLNQKKMPKNMFKKIILKNGLRVIMAPMKGTETATVLVLVKAGSRYEKEKENGLAHFMEHMFGKGTKKRPTVLDVTKKLDEIGANYNQFTSKEFTGYYAKTAKEHLKLTIDIISDMLINSKFSAKEIEKEKGVIVEEINMYKDMPMYLIGDLFEKLLYPSNSLGRTILGAKENVMSFQRKDFLDFFDSHYYSANSAVIIAGNFSEKKAVKLAEKYFLKMKKNENPLQFPPASSTGQAFEKGRSIKEQKRPQVLLKYKKTDQSHLHLGFRGYNIFHPDKYALGILAVILGGYFSSRIVHSLRGKQGLAYYVETETENYTDAGYLVTRAGVPNDKVEKAIKIILKEYKKIISGKIPETEIQRAKKHIKGKTIIALESSGEMANWIGSQEILKEKILTLKQIFAKIDRVGRKDIQKTAKEIFVPEKLNLALIGPFRDEKKFRKLLNI
jgi:predicted Zn-dependent peptidase